MTDSELIKSLEKRVATLEEQTQEQPAIAFTSSIQVSEGYGNYLVVKNSEKRKIVGCV